MNHLDAWAARWGVTHAAMLELAEALSHDDVTANPSNDPPGSEARVTSIVRLESAQAGAWLTRNNVGALRDKAGRFVRFGLANESRQQNTVIKSADLIGFRRCVIVTSDVGKTFAKFLSIECKEEAWKPSLNDPHETAQRRWRDFIISNGGEAAFVSGPGYFSLPPATIKLPILKR